MRTDAEAHHVARGGRVFTRDEIATVAAGLGARLREAPHAYRLTTGLLARG